MRRTWPFVAALAALPVLVLALSAPRAGFAQYTPEAALDRGRTLYTDTCASCHGLQGQGGGVPGLGIPSIGPGSDASTLDGIDLTLLIRNGKGAMPGVGGSWSKEDVGTVVALLRSWWTTTDPPAGDHAAQ